MSRKQRRARGAAALRQLASGQFEARISLGFDAAGRRIRKNLYAPSEGKLKAIMATERRRFEGRSRNANDAERVTLADYLDEWLEEEVRHRNRLATYVLRKSICRNHIVPHLGRLMLGVIEPSHVRGLLNALRLTNVGARTQQVVHTTLSRAFKAAVRDELIPRNVVQLVDTPRAPRIVKYILSEEEARRLLVAAQQDEFYALYVLAVTTGLRQGELFALQWADIDFRDSTIRVRATLTEDENRHLVRSEPKTNSSRRVVDLPEFAVAALRKHQMGNETFDGFVFHDTGGGPLRKSNFIRRNFRPLLQRAELPRITFHTLRHVANSILYAKGVNIRMLAERLGHSTTRTTIDHYSHVATGSQRAAARELDAIFGPQIGGHDQPKTQRLGNLGQPDKF